MARFAMTDQQYGKLHIRSRHNSAILTVDGGVDDEALKIIKGESQPPCFLSRSPVGEEVEIVRNVLVCGGWGILWCPLTLLLRSRGSRHVPRVIARRWRWRERIAAPYSRCAPTLTICRRRRANSTTKLCSSCTWRWRHAIARASLLLLLLVLQLLMRQHLGLLLRPHHLLIEGGTLGRHRAYGLPVLLLL